MATRLDETRANQGDPGDDQSDFIVQIPLAIQETGRCLKALALQSLDLIQDLLPLPHDLGEIDVDGESLLSPPKLSFMAALVSLSYLFAFPPKVFTRQLPLPSAIFSPSTYKLSSDHAEDAEHCHGDGYPDGDLT